MPSSTSAAPEPPGLLSPAWVVYLLAAITKTHGRDRLYIGYTNDPRRRTAEHNERAVPGRKRRGAARTAKHQPWRVLLIVDGFARERDAKVFERAWQRPDASALIPRGRLMERVTDLRYRRIDETLAVLRELRAGWPTRVRVRGDDGDINGALGLEPLPPWLLHRCADAF